MRFLFLALLLVGCGKSGGSSSTSESKSLWSLWTRESDGIVFDLREGELNTPLAFNYLLADGAVCACNFLATGSLSSGDYSMSSCTYTSGGTGDPGCSGANASGTYSINSSQLSVCDDDGCREYQ